MNVVRIWLSASAIVGLLAAGIAPAAACTSVIRNHSASPWRIVYYMTNGLLKSDQCPIDYMYPEQCTIAPNAEVTFTFSPDGDALSGRVQVTDAHDVRQTFSFRGGSCAYVVHDGNTGTVSMNEPSDGDMSIDGNFW